MCKSLDQSMILSGCRGGPYFRKYDRELVSKPAISLKNSWGGDSGGRFLIRKYNIKKTLLKHSVSRSLLYALRNETLGPQRGPKPGASRHQLSRVFLCFSFQNCFAPHEHDETDRKSGKSVLKRLHPLASAHRVDTQVAPRRHTTRQNRHLGRKAHTPSDTEAEVHRTWQHFRHNAQPTTASKTQPYNGYAREGR